VVAEDATGDGCPDLLLGANGFDELVNDAGAAYLIAAGLQLSRGSV